MIRKIAISAVAALLLTACGSSKKQAQGAYPETPATQAVTTAPGNAAAAEDAATWSDVQMPVRVELSKPVSFSLSGRATMLRDSMIHISMRVFGMEVAVVNVTNDSVYLVDKFHKYYFAEPLKTVLGSHMMSVGAMQDIMLGTQLGEANTLTFDNPGAKEPVTVTFSDFSTTPAGNAAGQVRIQAPVTGKQVDAVFVWSLDKAKWDSGQTVNFKRPSPSQYKRITMKSVLQMLNRN